MSLGANNLTTFSTITPFDPCQHIAHDPMTSNKSPSDRLPANKIWEPKTIPNACATKQPQNTPETSRKLPPWV
jgi:hypothetical protein